ncbi:hypothetical protein Dimus_010474, partial [Dionaea muscipula]
CTQRIKLNCCGQEIAFALLVFWHPLPLSLSLALVKFPYCLLEVTLSSLSKSMSDISEEGFSGVAVQVISNSCEGLVSNVVYALLGTSMMSRISFKFRSDY